MLLPKNVFPILLKWQYFSHHYNTFTIFEILVFTKILKMKKTRKNLVIGKNRIKNLEQNCLILKTVTGKNNDESCMIYTSRNY